MEEIMFAVVLVRSGNQSDLSHQFNRAGMRFGIVNQTLPIRIGITNAHVSDKIFIPTLAGVFQRGFGFRIIGIKIVFVVFLNNGIQRQQGFLFEGLLTLLRCGFISLLDLNAIFVCQFPYSRIKIQSLFFHYKRNGITSFVTCAKAVPGVSVYIDKERGGFLLMERAAATKITAAAL